MSEESQAAEEPQLDETVDTEASEDQERLHAQLEKQIDKFRKVWLMMDSPNENERSVAFRNLQKVMGKINETHEQLTGEKNFLNFADLLDKVENGGGGASNEELEQMQLVLEQYEEVNEALAIAEDMLRREVRMLRFLLETRGYEQVSIENPQEIATVFLDNVENIQQVCASINEFFDIPEDRINDAYTNRLSELFNTRYDDMHNGLTGLSRSIASWLLKKQGLPGTIEDIMEVQCIARGHDAILNEERALVEKLQTFEDVTQGLEEALKCLMHQTYSDQSMKEMLDNLEFMEQRLIKMDELEDAIRERDGEISSLQEQLQAAQEENARKDQSIVILNEAVDNLKATQRINVPLEDPTLENLDLDNPEDLRKSVETLMTVARNGPTESRMNKDDLRRENALLRKQLAMAQKGEETDRYDIVDRNTLAQLVQSNEELERAMQGYRRKLDDALGEGAQSWKEKNSNDLAALREKFEKEAAETKEAHEADKESAIKAAVEEAIAEKDDELKKVKDENAAYKIQATHLENEKIKFRRDVSKQVNIGIFRKVAVAGVTSAAIGAGGLIYIDSQYDLSSVPILHILEDNQEQQPAAQEETATPTTIAPPARP